MNPNRGGEQPAVNFEVPSVPNSEEYNATSEQVAEKPKTPESSPSRQSAPPVPLSPVPAVTGVPTIIPSDAGAQSIIASPPAKDIDKIEKVWVDKAKTIIAQTRDDPFLQNNEMSKVKAAYIEKRFNKKLKTDSATS